jgi:hypothetical protein
VASAPAVRALFLGAIVFYAAGAGAADWSPEVQRYYQAGFTADKLPARVSSVVAALDDRPLPFAQLTYRQSADVRFKRGGQLTRDTTVSVIPQGGSLVTVVGRDDSKDENAAVAFELSYRGLLVLRDQKYFPNAPIVTKIFRKLPPDHSPIMEVESVAPIADAHPADTGQRTTFVFEVAPSDDSAHAMKMQRVCQVGEDFDASAVDKALTGLARTITCDLFDPDGRTRDLHQEKIYLADYGVALLSKVVTMAFVADYRISDVHVTR